MRRQSIMVLSTFTLSLALLLPVEDAAADDPQQTEENTYEARLEEAAGLVLESCRAFSPPPKPAPGKTPWAKKKSQQSFLDAQRRFKEWQAAFTRSSVASITPSSLSATLGNTYAVAIPGVSYGELGSYVFLGDEDLSDYRSDATGRVLARAVNGQQLAIPASNKDNYSLRQRCSTMVAKAAKAGVDLKVDAGVANMGVDLEAVMNSTIQSETVLSVAYGSFENDLGGSFRRIQAKQSLSRADAPAVITAWLDLPDELMGGWVLSSMTALVVDVEESFEYDAAISAGVSHQAGVDYAFIRGDSSNDHKWSRDRGAAYESHTFNLYAAEGYGRANVPSPAALYAAWDSLTENPSVELSPQRTQANASEPAVVRVLVEPIIPEAHYVQQLRLVLPEGLSAAIDQERSGVLADEFDPGPRPYSVWVPVELHASSDYLQSLKGKSAEPVYVDFSLEFGRERLVNGVERSLSYPSYRTNITVSASPTLRADGELVRTADTLNVKYTGTIGVRTEANEDVSQLRGGSWSAQDPECEAVVADIHDLSFARTGEDWTVQLLAHPAAQGTYPVGTPRLCTVAVEKVTVSRAGGKPPVSRSVELRIRPAVANPEKTLALSKELDISEVVDPEATIEGTSVTEFLERRGLQLQDPDADVVVKEFLGARAGTAASYWEIDAEFVKADLREDMAKQ